MRRGAYIRQLKRDIEAWIAASVITPQQAEEMLRTAGPPETRQSIPFILAMLGAILLAFGAMTYVAANWQGLGKLERLIILGGTMTATYATAAVLFARAMPAYAQAAVLLGTALFGVNIMLVGQTYHMSAQWPDGILLWAVGTAIAALVVPSRPALALAILLFGLWSFGVTSLTDDPHLPYAIPFVVLLTAAWIWKWRAGLHLLAISFLVWSAINLAFFVANRDWDETHLFTLYVLIAVAIFGFTKIRSKYVFETALTRYGLFALFFSFFLLQLSGGAKETEMGWLIMVGVFASFCTLAIVLALISDNLRLMDAGVLIALALLAIAAPYLIEKGGYVAQYAYSAFYIGLTVWAVDYGLENDDRFFVNLAFTAFGIEVLWIYFTTFSTLLDQAIFFIVGGLILIVSAVVLERVRRQLLTADGGES